MEAACNRMLGMYERTGYYVSDTIDVPVNKKKTDQISAVSSNDQVTTSVMK